MFPWRKRMRGKEYCDEIVRLIDGVFRELDLDAQEKIQGGGEDEDIPLASFAPGGNR
jgi:hypothetical protein